MGDTEGRKGGPVTAAAESPPRAGLTFRVGIVGHRPNRLPTDAARLDQLRLTIRTILTEVQAAVREAAAREPETGLYAPGPPLLRAISPLAEGSDRIFAEEAIALGYELCSPMPFAREEFEKDFAPGAALEDRSLARFKTLLERAGQDGGLSLFEMDGERADAPAAYGAAGRIVLNQTDLLLAVWDGGAPGGAGGTVSTLKEAMRFHVPVLHIDPQTPDHWRILQSEADLTAAAVAVPPPEQLRKQVAHMVEREVRLPEDQETPSLTHARAFFAEHKPQFSVAFFWKLFRDILVDFRITTPRMNVARFEAQIRADWPTAKDGGEMPSPVANWVNGRLRAHFAWADGLANFDADSQRSSFILSYLLSASAVLVALLPVALRRFEVACTFIELAILSSILLLLIWSRRSRWQERWTEYRLLAELIRELRFLVPLGGGKPLPRMPAHMAVYGDPARTWMYWHMRAIARQTGIPSAQVTPAYIRDCLDFLARLVGDHNSGQMEFHRQTARRARVLAVRLRGMALFLFSATIAGVICRLLIHYFPVRFGFLPDSVMLLASAVLPAFGAALEGISNQGEFVRVAKRSAAMASGFEKYAGRIAGLKDPHLHDVIPLSSEIATAMVDEIVDWRAVFVDRTQ